MGKGKSSDGLDGVGNDIAIINSEDDKHDRSFLFGNRAATSCDEPK